MARPWEKGIGRPSPSASASAGTNNNKRPRPKDEASSSSEAAHACSSAVDGANAKAAPTHDGGSEAEPVPYVEVDDIRYYSDRFYLNLPTGLDGVKSGMADPWSGDAGPTACTAASVAAAAAAEGASRSTGGAKKEEEADFEPAKPRRQGRCTCGHSSPPPMLDRAALIRSLVSSSSPGEGLVGAIVATYTFDPEWMSHELPELFPPSSLDDAGGAGDVDDTGASKSKQEEADAAPVPTLVLHGHKGLRLYKRRRQPSSSSPTTAGGDDDKAGPAKDEGTAQKNGATRYSTETHRVGTDDDETRTVEVLCLDSDSSDDDDNPDQSRERGVGNHSEAKGSGSRRPLRPVQRRANDEEDETNATDDDEDATNGFGNVKEEEEDEVPPEEGWRQTLDDSDVDGYGSEDDGDNISHKRPPKRRVFADSVHVTEVYPTFVPHGSHDGHRDRSGGAERRSLNGSRSSGTGSASSPVALDDSSSDDEEDGEKHDREEVIVIDSSDDDDGRSSSGGEGGGGVDGVDRMTDHPRNPPQAPVPCAGDSVHPSLCVPPTAVRDRKRRQGVYHPKFMLLFERRGSVVVLVSTSNLTRTGACEGTWVQRFEPRSTPPIKGRPIKGGGGGGDGAHFGKKGCSSRSPTSRSSSACSTDFGPTLIDFLKRQCDACEPDRLTPDGFVRRYLGYNRGGLDELVERFKFEDAKVHLVPTVPGDHRGRRTVGGVGRHGGGGGGGARAAARAPLFGPQRVADVLHRLHRRGGGWKGRRRDDGKASVVKGETEARYSSPLYSPSSSCDGAAAADDDRLVVQTTSFGGNWTRDDLEEVARAYMGQDDRSKLHDASSHAANPRHKQENMRRSVPPEETIDAVDIVWPSQRYLNQVSAVQGKRRRLDEEESGGTTTDPVEDIRGHFCFFPTLNFNTNELCVISRMVQFRTAVPPQLPWPISPHIKSVARLLARDDDYDDRAGERRYHTGDRFQDAFSWFLLTSACLSRGAQGKATFMRGYESDEMSYSNFELGVLFCSDPRSDRLYGFRPKRCECSVREGETTRWSGGRNVHLPVPYELRPLPYQADQEDIDFVETPYFHELTPGVGGSGQMGLTPLGRRLNSKANALS